MTTAPTLFVDETKPFRFIGQEGLVATIHVTDTVDSRPRIEGDREQQILDATLEVLADVGYDRLSLPFQRR